MIRPFSRESFTLLEPKTSSFPTARDLHLPTRLPFSSLLRRRGRSFSFLSLLRHLIGPLPDSVNTPLAAIPKAIVPTTRGISQRGESSVHPIWSQRK
ncbi:unnamed protein product, partial [Larinioides sclopetarius]